MMLDLMTNKIRALLCMNTNMAPCIGNETRRWASANNMMNKWEKIKVKEACVLACTKEGAVITMLHASLRWLV
jgi:hypothetical protein